MTNKFGSTHYIFPKGQFIEYLSQNLCILEGEAEEMLDEFDHNVCKREDPGICPFCGEPLARYEEKGDWVIECNANGCLMIVGHIDKKDVLERMLEAGR